MNVNCDDRDRIFLDGFPEEWAALEQHATTCAACAEELRAWQQLSAAANEAKSAANCRPRPMEHQFSPQRT